LLARRWESALLVNVDNATLERLMSNEAAMDALMSIEGFRSLNADIQTIINKSEAVKKAKKEGVELTPKQKKELTEEEKEYKSKRKQIQEKLIKFATRVPIFMYLTDYRERSLKDVITQLEPGLFKKVTGLDVKDFELLISLGVFNGPLMNDAIYKFKRYEDSSLSYTGVDKHRGEDIGLFDTVISNTDYLYTMQQSSMEAPPALPMDLPDKPFFDDDIDDSEEAEEDEKPVKPAAVYKKPKGPEVRVTYVKPTPPKAAEPASEYKIAQPVAEEKLKIDCSGVKIGTELMHKVFGKGKVSDIDGRYMTVTFGGAEKKFQFPEAIQNGFLKMG